MNSDWRYAPATAEQKLKLRYFGCTWDEGITAGQAADAIKECARHFPEKAAASRNLTRSTDSPRTEAAGPAFVPPTPEQFSQIRSFGKTPPSGLTHDEAKIWIEQCNILFRPNSPPKKQLQGDEAQPQGASVQEVKTDALRSPEQPGGPQDQSESKSNVRTDSPTFTIKKPDRSLIAPEAGTTVPAPHTARGEGFFFGINLNSTTPREQGKPNLHPDTKPSSTFPSPPEPAESQYSPSHPPEHDYAANGFCKNCGWGRAFNLANQRPCLPSHVGAQKNRAELGSPSSPNSTTRIRTASPIQKLRLQFFGCSWRGAITAELADAALTDYARRFPKLAAAYQNHPATPEQLDELCRCGLSEQVGLSYGEAKEMIANELIKHARATASGLEDSGDGIGATGMIDSRCDAAERFESLLTVLGLTDGNHLLPVADAAKLLGIDTETGLTGARCRQIAERIESVGYCVEPDARFGAGIYAWKQTLCLFKRPSGERVKPTPAYSGAANLLQLSVLIAAADGQVDQTELDVFRQVIESQLELSLVDHQRLLALELLLTQNPAPAEKTMERIAQSVPVHKRLLVGKVLVKVATADSVVTTGERRALDRVFRAFCIPSATLQTLLPAQAPPENPNLDEQLQVQKVAECKVAQSVNGEKIFKAWTDDSNFVRKGHVLLFSHAQHWWLCPADAYRECSDVAAAEAVSRPPGSAIMELHEIFSGGAAAPQATPTLQSSRVQESEPRTRDAQASNKAAPCPLCGWIKCCCARSERIPERNGPATYPQARPTPRSQSGASPIAPAEMFPWLPDRVSSRSEQTPTASKLPVGFKLDMARVNAIANETKEVVGILSLLLAEDAGDSITPSNAALPPPTAVPAPTRGSGEIPRTTRFSGLDAALHPVLERLLTQDSWRRADFHKLAGEFHFMPLDIHDKLNEWSDEVLGEFLLAGEDPVVICRELIVKEAI